MKNRVVRLLVVIVMLVLALPLSGCSKVAELMEVEDEDDDDWDDEDDEEIDIEMLAAESVFGVKWYTQDGVYSAGTAFVMDSDVHGESLLVTAFHFLWPDGVESFKGEELPEFILGGEVYYVQDGFDTGATLKNCVVIEDADAVPEVDKDVAAFTLWDGEDLETLPLSTHKAKKGDVVYLLADLWDTEDVHENCVYEGKITSISGGSVFYELEGEHGTSGASGAPIVNQYGEVVAIHMGSNGSTLVGHAADSFLKQINNGTISDIEYTDDVYSLGMDDEDGDYEDDNYGDGNYGDDEDDIQIVQYKIGETVKTSLCSFSVGKVEEADSLEGYDLDSEEGMKYVVLDVPMSGITNPEYTAEILYMDFMIIWNEDYELPYEEGYEDGKLIFLIPDTVKDYKLCFYDYYESGDNYDDVMCYVVDL